MQKKIRIVSVGIVLVILLIGIIVMNNNSLYCNFNRTI